MTRADARSARALCSVEEGCGAGELNAGEESLGEFIVARGDGPETLGQVEEALDEIAFAVEGEIAPARSCSLDLDGDDWDYRSIREGDDEGVGVEGLVGDHGTAVGGFGQRLGASQIVILSQG